MEDLTKDELLEIMPLAADVADAFLPHLNYTMSRFAISSPMRRAAFLAQVAHESLQLTRMEESLFYKRADRLREIYPRYFAQMTEMDLALYLGQPQRVANRVYANRMGNGDEASGDGWRYRGRGLFMLTGKDNYTLCSHGIGVNLLEEPDKLLTPEYASVSAGWVWKWKGLNTLADQDDFEAITRRLNGGLNGQEDRVAFYDRATEVLA
jgi:putative chitinase